MAAASTPDDRDAVSWARIEAALDELLALPGAERDGAVLNIAAGDAALAAELRSLLARLTTEGSSLIDRPAAELLVSATPVPPGLAPGTRLGAWSVVETIGRGGMGQVYRGRRADGHFEQDVAIKLARADSATAWQRFPLERQIVARLDHPAIARLIDGGMVDSGQPYMVMELVTGQPITRWCSDHASDLAQRLGLFEAVCEAVAYAHRHLVIHRDIKPSNVMVTEQARVKLLDFGIARLLDAAGAATTGELMLTPAYAAPEQLSGEPLSTATDVYALGLLLHELLTGTSAQEVEHLPMAAAIHAVLHKQPRSPSNAARAQGVAPVAAAQLEGDLDAIVAKALRKEPAQRYASVDQLRADVERHRRHEPVSARRGNLAYVVGRALRRHRAWAAAGAVALLALGTGTGAVAWQAREARQQAQRAERVKGFVLSIFENADTDAGGSRATTAVDLLLQAQGRIDAEVGADPAVAVELMNSVAYSLLGLGEDAAARKLIEHSLSVAEQRLGPAHPRTLEGLVVYGELLVTDGHPAEAEAPLLRAIDALRRRGDAKALISALRWASSLRIDQGRSDEAVALAREAVQLAEAKHDASQRVERLESYSALSAALSAAGQPGRLELARKELELATEMSGGEQSGPVLDARSNLAVAQALEGDPALALQPLRDNVAAASRLLGPDHTRVSYTMSQLAFAQFAAGDADGAAATLRRVLSLDASAGRGRGTPNYGSDWTKLGDFLLTAHRDAEALAAYDQALVMVTQALGARHVRIASIHAGRALALARLGRLDAARAEADGLARPWSSDRRIAFAVASRLAEVRGLEGRHDEALALIHEARGALGESFDRLLQASARSTEGALLVDAGRPAEALVPLQTCIASLRQTQPGGSAALADALLAAGRAHLALGDATSALRETAETEQWWAAVDARRAPATLAALWHERALAASLERH